MPKDTKKPFLTPGKTGFDAVSIKQSIANHLTYTVGKDTITATNRDWFFTAAYVARDRLIDRWMETMRSYYTKDAKRVYYLSMEFLMGRSSYGTGTSESTDIRQRTAMLTVISGRRKMVHNVQLRGAPKARPSDRRERT